MTLLGGPEVAAGRHAVSDRRAAIAEAVSWYRARRWWPAMFGALVGVSLFFVARPALADDAYTTLAIARTLVESGTWGVWPDLPAHVATSPLNVLLLAPLVAATAAPVLSAGVLLVATLAATSWWLYRLAGGPAAVTGTLLLAGAPILNSAVGLEVYLCAALLVGLVHHTRSGPWWAAGLLLGLSPLARPDLVVAAAVVAAVSLRARVRATLALAVAVGAPFYLWAWVYFGTATPTTMAAKWALFHGTRGPVDGLWQLYPWFPAAVLLSVATLGAGVVACAVAIVRHDRAAAALGLAGAAHLAVIGVVGSGPAPYYLAPSVTGLGLCVVVVATRYSWPALVPAVVLTAAGLALLVTRGLPWADGVAPMRVNWATPHEYAAAAQALPPGTVESAGRGTLRGVGEIGTLAYFAPPATRVVEFLSDPGRAEPLVDEYRAAHWWAEPNYVWHDRTRPAPVQWRLLAVLDDSGRWPMTSPDAPRSLRLEPVRMAVGSR